MEPRTQFPARRLLWFLGPDRQAPRPLCKQATCTEGRQHPFPYGPDVLTRRCQSGRCRRENHALSRARLPPGHAGPEGSARPGRTLFHCTQSEKLESIEMRTEEMCPPKEPCVSEGVRPEACAARPPGNSEP